MNDKLNFIDERQKRRYEKVLQKTEEEYLQEIAILKSREDFLEEYEYFLQLLASPFSARKLQMRVEKPLAGLFCIQAPFEIFDAFDLHPVKLCGGSHTVQRLAASYLPVLMCPMLKSFMGNFDLQQESFADYRAVILPTTCDWVVKLPEIMQQDTENVHYLELPHLKETEKSQSRWLEEIFCLKELLEKITGKKLKPKQLQESINKVMNIWIIMDELTKLKRSGQLSGVWYTAITNTFMLDNLEVWSGQVNRTIEKLHRQQKQENSSRIFVAGSPIIFPNLKLLQLIEQAGMSITADDICSSERIMPGGIIYNDTSEYGMLRAIAERYHKACVCPTFADNSRRVNNIISKAKEYNIKGVIFNLLKGCHPYDNHSLAGDKWTPKFNLGYTFSDRTNAYISYGKFFVTPVYYNYFGTYANPNIKPETGNTIELGINHKFDDNFNFTAHVYKTETDNKIGYDSSIKKYVNIAKEKLTGWDMQLTKTFTKEFNMFVGYTHLNVEQTQDGITTYMNGGYLPKDSINIGVNYTNEKLDVGLVGRGIFGKGEDKPDYMFPCKNYWVVDLGINYKVNKNIKTFVKVNNLFDKLYSEQSGSSAVEPTRWYTREGRNFLVGMEYNF